MVNIGKKSNEMIWFLVSCLFIFVFKNLPLAVTANHLGQPGIYHLGRRAVLLSFYYKSTTEIWG